MKRTDVPCADAPAALDGLIDGELSDAERTRVHDHLASCSSCSRWIESQTTLNRLLGEGLVRYKAPDVLKARIHSALMQANESVPPIEGRLTSHWWPMLAAAAALLIVTNVATFSLSRTMFGYRAVTEEVLASHVRSLMPGHLVDVVSTDQHNVKPWFNGRTALSPPVPSLEPQNFHLVGGRLDYVAGTPTAVVVYSRRLHSINVFARPNPGPDSPEASHTDQGYHFFTWRAANIEFWVVSDLNPRELAEFTRVYRQAEAAR